MSYTHEIFEILAKEYAMLRKSIDARKERLKRVRRDYSSLFGSTGIPEELMGGLQKLTESYEKLDAEEIEKFEELMKDPSVLRGRNIARKIGILDDDRADWEDEGPWEDASPYDDIEIEETLEEKTAQEQLDAIKAMAKSLSKKRTTFGDL